MENFENNARRVKQKNFYLLHLDAPRIIIIMTVIIGIIAGAFLLGMNFNFNDDKNNLALKKNNLIIDEHKELGMLNELPDLHDDEISTKNIPEDQEEVTLESITKKETPKIAKREIDEPSDISMGKNVQVVSTKTFQNKKKTQKVTKKQANKQDYAKSPKKHKSRKNKRKTKKSVEKNDSNIVEVASNRSFRSRKNKSPHYSIQIASYDKKSKAISEMESLKNKHFETYINKSKVKGKNYYRVRVGPIKSQKKALNILNEIQNFSRYEDSYMIRE